MIKINLLPQKRAKRQAAVRGPRVASSGDAGGKQMLLGVAAILGAATIVLLVFDMPARAARADYDDKQKQLAKEIKLKQPQLDGYDKLQQAEKDATTKIQSIDRLVQNKVVPANILQELGYVLTSRGPTMTKKMQDAQKNDANKQFQDDWDASHVWLQSFNDNLGTFRLEGGAQSKEDVTQLSKRMAASIYFLDVSLAAGARVSDRDSGLSYYNFVITGKLVY
ncbi:MAG: PilN domain-containing protein [Kofleriaceae bacterium]